MGATTSSPVQPLERSRKLSTPSGTNAATMVRCASSCTILPCRTRLSQQRPPAPNSIRKWSVREGPGLEIRILPLPLPSRSTSRTPLLIRGPRRQRCRGNASSSGAQGDAPHRLSDVIERLVCRFRPAFSPCTPARWRHLVSRPSRAPTLVGACMCRLSEGFCPLSLVLIDGLGALVLIISQCPARGPGDVTSDFEAFCWDIAHAVRRVVARVLFRAYVLKGVKFTVFFMPTAHEGWHWS